jgi:predicted DNA-binding transcriptional regulator YafY
MREERDNQIRRTARLLEMIQQIANTPQFWTRKRLANYHQVSERMIQKDLEIIRLRLGLTIKTEGDGYYFIRLPQLPATLFSFSEAIALLSASRAAQAMPGVNSTELAVAITRLESIFPEEIRPLLKDTLDHLPRKALKTHRQTMLTLFYRAYFEQKQIQMVYQPQKEKEGILRVVDPYFILPYGRSWHVIAYDHLREFILQFKLDRVMSAQLLESTYQRPKDFDIDEYLGDTWGLMRGAANEAEDVELLFDEVAGRWVSEEHWHKSQMIEENEDGTFSIRFWVGVTPEMVNWILYYGSRVKVINPEWLREKVAEEHRKAT